MNEYGSGLSPHPLPVAFASFDCLSMSVWRMAFVTSHLALSRVLASIIRKYSDTAALEKGEQLAAEHAAEHADRQEEVAP
jgi:hypothetical protein